MLPHVGGEQLLLAELVERGDEGEHGHQDAGGEEDGVQGPTAIAQAIAITVPATSGRPAYFGTSR